MKRIPVSVQMYTLREESSKDFIGTLSKVADIGYQGVEFAGFGGMPAKEMKAVLSDLGLCVSSSHVGIKALEEELEHVISYQVELGGKHIVCPSFPAERRNQFDEYLKLADFLNLAGEKCRKSGLTLSYHNHDFELNCSQEGKSALQVLLEETNPENVKIEFDVYWLQRAGEDPVQWLKKYAGRTPLIHLKDMTKDDRQFFAELGTGCMDLKSILEQGQPSEVEWWVVEQDICLRDPFESISMSLEYLKRGKIIE
jgi:sugar phosphate isomerase/epimerase